MKFSIKIFLLFVIPFLFVFVALYLFEGYTNIHSIQIIGIKQLKGLEILYNKNILFFSEKKYESSLYDQNPEVKKISLTKKWPDNLIIKVEMSSIIAVLPVHQGYYFLSKEGRIIKKDRQKIFSETIIHFYQNLNFDEYEVGENIKSIDINDSLIVLSKLTDLGIKIDSIDIDGLDVIVLKNKDIEYVFTTQKDIQMQYQNLKLILERFKIEDRRYKRIDVRFDKPIVKL